MMEQTAATTKNRLLRRATIYFFAGMAVLTLFSNTIVNYSLPRVQVKNFESGMMFRQIQAEGTISAQLQHTINFGAPRIVDQVKVEVGSPVLVGDVIATLKHCCRQHALVVEPGPDGEPLVRGIFSASQIARQMGIPLQTAEVARTFAEIEAAIAS